MVMESIDLGDRRELIDLIYGPQKGEIDKTPTASSTTLTPRTENEKIKKTKKSRVVCSYTTILLLFILAAAAVILSGFISYWLTRQEYEMKLAALPFAAIPRRNVTKLMREEETYEEEEPSEGPTMEELRLPDTLEPIWLVQHDLRCTCRDMSRCPEGKNFTTDGNILIKLAVKQPTTELYDAKDLSFPVDANKVKILTERFATRSERQVMDDSSLPFNGRISDNLTGLFVSSYMRSDGRSRLAAVTDIQPGSARTLFPCFDEPHFKAPLSLTILHPKGTTATANAMEIAAGQATSDPMWLKTSFDATRPLPTSLTAFTLTDFVKAQTTTDTGAKIRVYSRPEAINSTEFALETSAKVLEFLQRYLAVPPRSAKLDVFALPELAKAEMSGDGLILVREDRLLYDPKLDTIEGKVQVAQTICHEFTKQWFGNVMGKSDLRGLWMNDALAKYMEYICLENLFTGLDKNSYQTVDSVEQALLDDARSLSHPMVLDMESPSGAGLMADEITSDKGAALLRMLKEVIGEDNFQRGIQVTLTQLLHFF
ncbi:peptidase family M1 [Ostertagia ostertagi]